MVKRISAIFKSNTRCCVYQHAKKRKKKRHEKISEKRSAAAQLLDWNQTVASKLAKLDGWKAKKLKYKGYLYIKWLKSRITNLL